MSDKLDTPSGILTAAFTFLTPFLRQAVGASAENVADAKRALSLHFSPLSRVLIAALRET